MFASIINYGITSRAFMQELCKLYLYNPRDYAADAYRKVDDKAFGGGGGMVMKIEPLELTLRAVIEHNKQYNIQDSINIYLSPQGKPVDQNIINRLLQLSAINLVCGRYEGVDERFIKRNVDLELSVADIVVSGGELPAMLLIDAIIRHLPNALNNKNSAINDSFNNGLLDYPHYTIPQDYCGDKVPDCLINGDHKKIALWRKQMSLWNTYQKRPDLLESYSLNIVEAQLLKKMITDNQS